MNQKEYKEFLESKRNTVLELELNARYQKATYELMYYALEAKKIEEDYIKLLPKKNEVQQEGQSV